MIHKDAWCSWGNPKNVARRKCTKQTTSDKLDIIKVKPDVKKLEGHLQGGQIEEMILQAEMN